MSDSIRITINGIPGEAPCDSTVLDVVEKAGALGPGFAVAVNDAIVRRDTYPQVKLSPGDRVEIIHAVGGG